MTEALLTGEPQTPTQATTAAKDPAPAPSSGAPDQGKQPPAETPKEPAKGLLTTEEKKAEDKAPTAPEKYDLKLEGDIKLSAPMQKGFEAAAREVGLTNEAANKLLNSLVKSHQESQQAAMESMRKTWAEEARANKEWGGDKLPETLSFAKKALQEFGSKELPELLEATGLSDNPLVIGLLANVGRKVGGDKIVSGAPPKGSDDDRAAVLYPSMKK